MGIFGDKQEGTATAQPQIGDKKAKQKAADEARRAEKKAALDVLREYVGEQVKANAVPEDKLFAIKTALFALMPQRSSTPTVKETMQDKLLRLFNGKKTVDGMEVYQFEGTHWGVSDMRRNITIAIKTGEPDKRLWIEYNGKTDEYTLLATGAKAPLGWMGYIPADVAAAE